jgi:hypothetical protein
MEDTSNKLTIQDTSKQDLLNYFKTNNSFVGILSTSQQVKFGKTKAGKPIYQIHPLKKILPPFWITYGGKLTGRIIIQFKFKEWPDNSKLPFAEIISILEETNFSNILLYHYQIERKPFIKKLPELNQFEKELVRKKLNDLTIFSIDPKGCIDIDDAISIEKISDSCYKVGVHIAQPICWLTEEEIIERSRKAISTLYLSETTGNKNLWSDEITEKASLFVNQEKPAYSTIFTISDNKIISTESFPSLIINKLNTDYDNIDYPFIKECKSLTEKLIGREIDSHELVSHWMIMTNQYIGSTFENIPFRSQNEKAIEEKELDVKIKQVFTNMQLEGAFYSYDKDFHHSLNLKKYTHFTSPIRRIIDTIIHWNITYKRSIDLDLDKINILDKKTKKFHQQIKLNDVINKLPDELEVSGWLYSQGCIGSNSYSQGCIGSNSYSQGCIGSQGSIGNNKCIVYFQDLGFMKVKLWHDKFNYLHENKENDLIIGKEYKFKINKIKGLLPIQRLVISFIKKN